MNDIKIYNYGGNDMRTVSKNGEPWFVATDVCRILEIGNRTMALEPLDEDKKALISIEGLGRGNNSGNIVNDPGLYVLILSSHKPQAHTYWTLKGRLFLYGLFKSKRGLLTVIERSATVWA